MARRYGGPARRWRWALVRLVFIAVLASPRAPTPVRPRVLRRLPLAPQMAWRGLVWIRYPAARRLYRVSLAIPLPMRSGWLKPAPEGLAGARWTDWFALGSIASQPWPAPT